MAAIAAWAMATRRPPAADKACRRPGRPAARGAAAVIEARHAALARTRGAVMTLGWSDLAAGSLSRIGVGNVEHGSYVRPGGPARDVVVHARRRGWLQPAPARQSTRSSAPATWSCSRPTGIDSASRRRSRWPVPAPTSPIASSPGTANPVRRRAGRRRALPAYTGMTMKTDIHPEYVEAHVRCTCGNEFTTRSTSQRSVWRSARTAIRSTRASRSWSTPVAAWSASSAAPPSAARVSAAWPDVESLVEQIEARYAEAQARCRTPR